MKPLINKWSNTCCGRSITTVNGGGDDDDDEDDDDDDDEYDDDDDDDDVDDDDDDDDGWSWMNRFVDGKNVWERKKWQSYWHHVILRCDIVPN